MAKLHFSNICIRQESLSNIPKTVDIRMSSNSNI